jgi:hypothetical protein
VDSSLFEQVADALRGMLPPELGPLRLRVRRYGLKAWFGPADPPREHYEAQVISPDAVRGAKVLALEVGFHTEHPRQADNDAVIAKLQSGEKKWRRVVGTEAEVGPFLGKADVWRRVSETWADPDLNDEDLPLELATRLTDYVTALEPLLRK